MLISILELFIGTWIPTEMFYCMFCTWEDFQGWIAQWKEMRENNEPIEDQDSYVGANSRALCIHE